MSKTSRTKERRVERERRRRRNQQMLAVAIVVVVIVLLGGLLLTRALPSEVGIPEGVAERYEGLRTGVTDEGFPRLGEPDAPVRVVEYSSFSCPGCGAFHSQAVPGLVERVRDGDISFTYVPLLTGNVPNAEGAARTALCAGEQGQFWPMHDVLFSWQGDLAAPFTDGRLRAAVSALELNENTFTQCFNSDRISSVLSRAQAENVLSTPTITVNGVTVEPSAGPGAVPTLDDVNRAINEALALLGRVPGQQPVEEPEAETTPEPEPEATPEVTPEPEATAEATAEPEAEENGDS